MATYGIDKYVYVLANNAVELLGTSPTLQLDDSVIDSDAELITYLGDLSGDTPLDTSAAENIQFVGWSLANTYASSPASSTQDLTSVVLSSLAFSDLSSSSVTNVYPVFQYYTDSAYSSVDDSPNEPDSGVSDTPYYDSVPSDRNQEERNKVVNTALTSYPEPYLSGLKLEGGIELWNPATETGLTLNTIDSNNVIWVVSEIEGWWSLPEPELPDLPRGWGDGSYDAIGRWANRLITLTGSFLPQAPEDVPTARNTLMSYLSPMVKTATAGYLIVTEDGVTKKAAKVRLSGTPMVTSVNARGRHNFTINFKAVDPIKYEFVDGDPDGYRVEPVDTSSGSATATITNSGNVAVPIIIEVSGLTSIPSTSNPPTITNAETSGEGIVITTATPSGHTMEIDTYNREILDVETSTQTVTNARSRASVLIEWLYLEPGSNEIEFTGFPSGSSVNVYYRSGWIS